MKITALVHTRNEERWLDGCLQSLEWADELVVADMASQDQTREIARRHGARIIEMPVAPIVEQVRALAIAECKGDWILVVDADERVTPGLASRLRFLADNPEADAYGIPRKNYFFEEWMEHMLWPDYQIRFFKNGSVSWPVGIHSLPSVNGRLKHLPEDSSEALEHPGAHFDISSTLSKAIRYGQLELGRIESNLRGPVWAYVIRRPITEFLGRYFGGGWRHGIYGLMQCLVLANYQFVAAIHYWAANRRQPDHISPRKLRCLVVVETIRTALRAIRCRLR